MLNQLTIICCVCLLYFAGCEDTDIRMATEAGLDAVKAVTLSDKAVQELAMQSVQYTDSKHRIAPAEDKYEQRLRRLIGEHLNEGKLHFDCKVYLSNEVNAFAMANGTIRIYRGLMDMLDDGELRFVIGHEMGHIAKNHIRKKIQLAYAASAVRKGIASQNSTFGEIARSQLGGFAELLMGAQFSQLEEKEADDYGLSYLKRKGYDPKDAVSALRKLATLDNTHSFLSSHPAPGKRADRLALQLKGKALSVEDSQQNLLHKVTAYLERRFPTLYEKLSDFLPWLTKEAS